MSRTLCVYGLCALLGAGSVIAWRALVPEAGDRFVDVAERAPPGIAGPAGFTEEVSSVAVGGSAARAAILRLAASTAAGADGIVELALGLPAIDRQGFIADALVGLAREQPAAAMDAALGQPAYWHRVDTVKRIAALWGREDPLAGLDYARGRRIAETDMRYAFRRTVLESWAGTDPDAALSFLLSPEGQRSLFAESGDGFGIARLIAERRAEEVLAAAAGLPKGTIRTALRGAAIESLVESDPQAALPETLPGPVDEDRRQWIDAVARIWPRQNPVAALAWARRLEGAPQTLAEVARAVHAALPERTLELGLCEIDRFIDPVCRR